MDVFFTNGHGGDPYPPSSLPWPSVKNMPKSSFCHTSGDTEQSIALRSRSICILVGLQWCVGIPMD